VQINNRAAASASADGKIVRCYSNTIQHVRVIYRFSTSVELSSQKIYIQVKETLSLLKSETAENKR